MRGKELFGRRRGRAAGWTAALRILCLCAAVSALLSGCWQDEPEEPPAAGLVQSVGEEETPPVSALPEVFALPYSPEQTLDPVTCPDGMQQTAVSLVCEGLFRLSGSLEPENLLCGSYTYDPDTFTYVFSLRSGVAFSDGTPLTAQDVRSTLERARQSERYGSRLSRVVSVSAGDGAVTVRLSAASTAFPALLDIPVVKAGTQDSLPVGTGPYRFSDGEGELFLEENPSWWQGESRPVSRIALVEVSGQDTMLYRFSSHDVQLITADLTGASPVSLTGNVSVYDTGTAVMQYIGCNTTAPPLDDPALRRALWSGIDRGHIAGAFLSGHGTAAQFPIPPQSPLYPKALERPFSYDGLAQAVLQSGYVPERTLTLLVNEENGFKVSVAEYLAEAFTAAGVPVEVRALPWEEYAAALEVGDFDLYYGEVRLTADWDLSALLGGEGALNYGGWADPGTEERMASFAAAANRAAAAEELCAYLREQAPILPVCFKCASVLTQAGVVEDLTPTAAEPFYRLSGCTVHLKETSPAAGGNS